MPSFTDSAVTITDSVRYQGASGDMNPMHHDAGRARERGYDDAFTVGMLPAGVLGSTVARWLAPYSPQRFKVRFRSQVWPGDTLTYSAEVVGERLLNGRRLLDLEMSVHNQRGEACLLGEGSWIGDADA